MLTQRSHQPEWMDLGPPYYSSEEYRDCLHYLDRIGYLLGGDRATFRALDKLTPVPTSILDVGCGGGLFTMKLAARYPHARVVGSDISSDAIAFAAENLKRCNPPLSNIHFQLSPSSHLDETIAFDVVTATLMCHHLTDEELITFIQEACRVARQAVILNDLHRHRMASLGFGLLVPFCFPNRLIWHDGLLSIRRAFTKQEWKNILKAADISEDRYSITWHWAFRWIVTIDVKKYGHI